MTRLGLAVAAFVATAAMASKAHAADVTIDFSGLGVGGSLLLNYGTATDAKYPSAYEVTGISGWFSDTNDGLGIVNAAIGPLVPITRDAPDSTNLLAPKDFSRFAVASGLPPESDGSLSYDNLFWPGGSPQTANDYPPHGGVLDIYGLMFSIGGGRVVDLWSAGDGGSGVDYGVAVATASTALDRVTGVALPEPGALWLLGSGLLALLAGRWHASSHRRGRLKRVC